MHIDLDSLYNALRGFCDVADLLRFLYGCKSWPMMTNMTSPGALTSGTPCTGVLAPFLGPPTGTKNMPKPVKRLLLVRVVLDHSSISWLSDGRSPLAIS